MPTRNDYIVLHSPTGKRHVCAKAHVCRITDDVSGYTKGIGALVSVGAERFGVVETVDDVVDRLTDD